MRERREEKMRRLESFFDHESIPLINYGYVIYRGASMVTITITVLVANTYISTIYIAGNGWHIWSDIVQE
jgi:hypothetical protein